jgi:hypothetical protein
MELSLLLIGRKGMIIFLVCKTSEQMRGSFWLPLICYIMSVFFWINRTWMLRSCCT